MEDGFGFKLKKGKYIVISGVLERGNCKLNV